MSVGQFTALLYHGTRLAAVPAYFSSEEHAIEVCALLLRTRHYYQILLYDPRGKLIATYKPEQIP